MSQSQGVNWNTAPSVERTQSVVGLVQHRTMVGSLARQFGMDNGVVLVIRLGHASTRIPLVDTVADLG